MERGFFGLQSFPVLDLPQQQLNIHWNYTEGRWVLPRQTHQFASNLCALYMFLHVFFPDKYFKKSETDRSSPFSIIYTTAKKQLCVLINQGWIFFSVASLAEVKNLPVIKKPQVIQIIIHFNANWYKEREDLQSGTPSGKDVTLSLGLRTLHSRLQLKTSATLTLLENIFSSELCADLSCLPSKLHTVLSVNFLPQDKHHTWIQVHEDYHLITYITSRKFCWVFLTHLCEKHFSTKDLLYKTYPKMENTKIEQTPVILMLIVLVKWEK